MCQPRSEGGRRCPIHRHDSVAYLQLAEKNTGLNRRQVENIFRELSREGRHTEDPTEEQWRATLTDFKIAMEATNGNRNVKNSLEKAFDNFTVPDGKTYYALQKLQENVANKAEKLNDLFAQVAMEKGMPVANVKRRFNRYSNAVDISRGAETPEDYSQRAYLFAKNNNLPYDKASVVAIEQLRNLPVQRDDVHRVTRHNVSSSSNVISSIGYNSEGGRVELTLNNDGDFAYHNVPEEEWNDAFNNGAPIFAKIRNIMSNPDYKYNNESDEARDRYNIHCESCGQFASPVSHICPERAVDVENEGLSQNQNIRALEGTSSHADEYNVFVMESNLRAEEANNSTANDESTNVTIIEPVVDSNAYNPVEPSRVNQSENTITRTPLIRADMEEPIVENGYYDYSVHRNNPESYLYQSPSYGDSVDFNGFEEELRHDLENGLVLSAVVQDKTLYRPFSRIYKVISIVRNSKFARLDTDRSNVYINTLNDGIKTFDDSISFTLEDRNAKLQEVRDGSAPLLDNRVSYTQAVVYDSTLRTQPKMLIPKIADLKKAMRDNNEFYIPIVLDMNHASALHRNYSSNDIDITVQDDQGYKQVAESAAWQNDSLNGYLKYAKQADGTFKSVSDPRQLRCECVAWRNNRYCEHVDNLMRRADNMLQQSVKPNPTNRTRVDLSALPNARYLTAALSRREDLTITPPNETDGTELNYTFTALNPSDSSSRRFSKKITDHSSNIGYAYAMQDVDPSSFDTYREASEILEAARYLRTVKTIDNFKPTLKACLNKKGTVTVPFNTSYSRYYYGEAKNVTGTVTFARNAEGETYVKSDNLQCDCSDYREDYRCKHINLTVHTANLIDSDVASLYTIQNRNSLRSILNPETNDNFVLYRDMREIQEYQLTQTERETITEDELRERAVALAEERRREAEERARERAERLRVRAERQREENRAYHERQAITLNTAVDRWKQENPERAAAIVAYRENMMNKWENVEPSYTNNPELATTAIANALARKANGENPIEFRSEGVLDGMSDGPAGRKFGIELEFDIQGANRNVALATIGRELHEAGLTTTPEQVRYHSAGNNGYATWSFEQDCTVDAELVSPILDDSPESWEQVRIATEIITRNGGKATTRAGSHVHVSTGSYENSSAKRAELLRFNREHQDMVYRLASDPKRGTHRGWSWCAPNVDDHGGELDDTVNSAENIFAGDHSSHNVGLNLSAMRTDLGKSNVEFRMWDATLDAGTIQAQVMLSAAMTDYAERTVLKDKKSLVRNSINDIGHAATENTAKHDISGDTGFASFVDKLFRKDEDKAHIASLFAVTNWQRT